MSNSIVSIEKIREGWRVVRHPIVAPNKIDRYRFTIVGADAYENFHQAARVYEQTRNPRKLEL